MTLCIYNQAAKAHYCLSCATATFGLSFINQAKKSGEVTMAGFGCISPREMPAGISCARCWRTPKSTLARSMTLAGTAPRTLLNRGRRGVALTPEALRAGTIVQTRKDGVPCRYWPDGHGTGQRPALSHDQITLMTGLDIDNYIAGRAVMVPILKDGD